MRPALTRCETLLAYALAKLCEPYDQAIYAASGQLLSGHTLQHLIAACAAWPVIAAVASRSGRQNGRNTAVQTA